MSTRKTVAVTVLVLAALVWPSKLLAQGQQEMVHKRGRIWENVANDGWIGSLGAWDYVVALPFGLFPGFEGFEHPVGNEDLAIDAFANANMHNFRSGVWIVASNFNKPGPPPSYSPTPTSFDVYTSGLQEGTYGVADIRDPLVMERNYMEEPGFDPLLPEELVTGYWHTNTGISVTRRSYQWSFPEYRDFIIYDYIFVNTGQIVSTQTRRVVPNIEDFQQTLSGVYFVFHGGISVSTKSQINFHSELTAVQAGAFGWKPESYHDYYHNYGDGELVFSTNANGGKEPLSDDPYPKKAPERWKSRFGDELQSPAAFGFLALYASPRAGVPRPTPKPDFLRIDTHKGGRFNNATLDLESFRTNQPKVNLYTFASTPDTQAFLGNNGRRFNFYTQSYGPYTLAPGDSVRIVMAEIAGVMDMREVIAGDLEGHFPDSTIAAILRNADHARNAVRWGLGGVNSDGVPIAADVPEPPPPPTCNAVNSSIGLDKPRLAVVWDKSAEEAQLVDASGALFYDGASDLSGYRVYRSTDFQYVSDTRLPAFRGEAWMLLADISIHDAGDLFNDETRRYEYVDSTVVYGFRYGYYVAAYRNADPSRTWTSVNGTVLSGIPELASSSINKTAGISAAPGPSTTFDIFVAPNPYVYGDPLRSFGVSKPYSIEFRNLPEKCTIRVYTIMGDLVKELEHQPDAVGNKYGSEEWGQTTDSGLLVAPGLYVFHVESHTPGAEGTFTGKFMIIR